MKPRSAKQKGRKFEQKIVLDIQEFVGLKDEDVRKSAASTGGEDIIFSKKARERFPYSIECKNKERLNIWNAITQSKKNAGKYEPLVVFTKNREDIYVTLRWDKFLDLLSRDDLCNYYINENRGKYIIEDKTDES